MSVERYTVTAESAAELVADLSPLAAVPGVRCVLVVDRGGRIISAAGDELGTDVIAFATLTAADFSANEQLARLVGERGFRALVHKGDNSSVYVEDVAGRAVVAVLYSSAVRAGLVRELARNAVQRVALTLARMSERERLQPPLRDTLLADADEEIDRLFDW